MNQRPDPVVVADPELYRSQNAMCPVNRADRILSQLLVALRNLDSITFQFSLDLGSESDDHFLRG